MECRRLQVTMVSVGHHYSLRKWHERELQLDGSGGYRIVNLEEGSQPESPPPSTTSKPLPIAQSPVGRRNRRRNLADRTKSAPQSGADELWTRKRQLDLFRALGGTAGEMPEADGLRRNAPLI